MVDVNKLRGIIVGRGFSQRQVAAELGMTEKTFYTKMKKGIFDSDEMSAMIELLCIEDPCAVFFANVGA